MGLNMRTGSKADNVALFANDPCRAHWNRKSIRDMGVSNWKARRGNLQNRPHPSENMQWEVWLSVTKKRLINLEKRANGEKANDRETSQTNCDVPLYPNPHFERYFGRCGGVVNI